MCFEGFWYIYLIGLQKDYSDLYFHRPTNTGRLKYLAKLITEDYNAVLFCLISSDVWTIFMLKFISEVTSEIDLNEELRRKPTFENDRLSVGHCRLPTTFPGLFR